MEAPVGAGVLGVPRPVLAFAGAWTEDTTVKGLEPPVGGMPLWPAETVGVAALLPDVPLAGDATVSTVAIDSFGEAGA
jgi:hypothetical protein